MVLRDGIFSGLSRLYQNHLLSRERGRCGLSDLGRLLWMWHKQRENSWRACDRHVSDGCTVDGNLFGTYSFPLQPSISFYSVLWGSLEPPRSRVPGGRLRRPSVIMPRQHLSQFSAMCDWLSLWKAGSEVWHHPPRLLFTKWPVTILWPEK